jgi:hypothetical protein
MKDICLIGDVHGCFDELNSLLTAINFHPEKIRLIFLGDLLDRGPNSVDCVRLVRSMCQNGEAECVAGNHENNHVRRRGHEVRKALTGKPNPMKPLSPLDTEAHRNFSNDDIDWMRKLPLKIHLKDNWYAIHGGLEPAYSFDEQSPNQIIRCRYVNKDGKAVPLGKDKSQPENSVYWTDMWNGPQSIVYGHCVHSLHTPLVDVRPNGVKCIGIDTGCVYGGCLTAYFLDRNEFVKVKAKREYAHIKANFEE